MGSARQLSRSQLGPGLRRGSAECVADRQAPVTLPPHIRVNLAQADMPANLSPGATIKLQARLMPPNEATVPGAYDFRRVAWFDRLGATGKGIAPVTVLTPGSAIERPARAPRRAYRGAGAGQRGRDRGGAGGGGRRRDQPGGFGRDAALGARASAVGQRAAHHRGGRDDDPVGHAVARAFPVDRAAGPRAGGRGGRGGAGGDRLYDADRQSGADDAVVHRRACWC